LTLQERAALKNNSDNSPPEPKQIVYQPQQQQQQVGYQPYQQPQQQQQYPPQSQQYQRQPSYEEKSSYEQQHALAAPPYNQPAPAYNSQPPAGGGLVSPTRVAPTPPSRINYVLALYDYDAQAEGDLSFKKDDKIELVNRTEDANDWWTGKLRGVVGVFPGINNIEDVEILDSLDLHKLFYYRQLCDRNVNHSKKQTKQILNKLSCRSVCKEMYFKSRD
jgi:amphiphysin